MNVNSDGEIIKFRSPYNYDRDAASAETALTCLDPTRTQQQFKEECDINVILERFGVTGQLPITTRQPMTGDFVNVTGDFQQALNAINDAQQNFMTLPAKTRERFDNDARKFVQFCVDPANIDAVRELGLAPPIAQPQPNVKEPTNGSE